MSFENFEFVKHGAQVGRARLSFKDSFIERFLDGTINVAVDFRIEDVDDMIRVWIARRSENIRGESCFDLQIQITDQEDKACEMRSVVADMAIENSDGVKKGRLCRTWWQSMMRGSSPRITPPFWWLTGHARADASAMAAQRLKYGSDSDLALADNLFRYPVRPDLLDAIRTLGWTVDGRGIAIQSLDDRIEVIDAFYGPFN